MQSEEEYMHFYDRGQILQGKHQTWDEILLNLKKEGATEETATEIVKQLKLITYAKKTKAGLNYIGIGVVLLLVSFIYVCANFYTQNNFTYVMYGFTSAGLLLIFYGLFEMFG